MVRNNQSSFFSKTSSWSFCSVPALGASTFGPKSPSLLPKPTTQPSPSPSPSFWTWGTLRPQPWESHTSHYTLEGLDSPAPPFSATPFIGLLGLIHCPFSIAKTRPTRPASFDTFTEGQLPSHHCRQSQKHSSNSNIRASTLPAGRNWQQAELPPRTLDPTSHIQPSVKDGKRHAAQSSHHSFPQELRNHPDPRQRSLVGFPVRTARQPCVHHDPLWSRHNIPTSYLPNPALETPPSRVTSVSSPLSVPSHSRSLGRPPFSLCPGRGTSIPRNPTRKSSRQSLPRSRRPRDYKHTVHGLNHRQHPAARWPENWRHPQRTPSSGRRPTRHWHHFGVTFNSGQWTPQQSRPLCRSSSPGCHTCERTRVPRTAPNTTLQICRPGHRSWWPLEPGSHNLPTVVGPSESPNHPEGLVHECLDPPVVCSNHPCSYDRLCGQSPGIWLRREHRHRRQPTSYQWGAGRSQPPPQPPAASQPAPKEHWLGLGPVSLHIRSRRYINGTCLETA